LIDSREATLTFKNQRFIEEGAVPSETQVVGKAWAKSNKDGSPDRRFNDNYQIPVVQYGSLSFTSPSGLHEEYQCSNPVLAERFAKAWNAFQAAFSNGGLAPPPGSHSRTAVRDIDGPTERFLNANKAFLDGVLGKTTSREEFAAYVLIVSEFVADVKGFAEDIAASVGWLESLGLPKRKLTRFRSMQASFQQALDQFVITYRPFENISATDKPTNIDLTAYTEALATFVKAVATFRNESVAVVRKLAEPYS
jgi:hypothetical protein